jgi:hypothetical protein
MERFSVVTHLVETEYYSPTLARNERQTMFSYDSFDRSVRSLSIRNDRLNLRRLSLSADLLKARATGLPVDFTRLQQADFVLYLRSETTRTARWWPDTLVYSSRWASPFEIFARSRSRRYFDAFKNVLAVADKAELVAALDRIKADGRTPRWQFETVDPSRLAGIEEICTRP